MTGTHISMLTMIKIDISDNPFIKDDIFEATVIFLPRGTPVGMVFHYCENHNMSYFYQSKKYIPWNRAFFERKITNVWILSIGRKEPKKVQQVMEASSIQHITVICRRIQGIIA